MVPEGALRVLAVGRVHGVSGGGAGLVRHDEGGQDLAVRGVRVIGGVVANVGPGDGLRPAVAHVVALAGVVPRLQLDEVGLQVQYLAKAVLEVLLAAAVPVAVGGVVFELQRRHAHDEGLAGRVGAVEVRHVIGGRHDDISLGILRPRVPVHRAVERGVFGSEEVGGGRNVLERWHKVDRVAGAGHDLLELDFPPVVDGVLAKRVSGCSTL